MEKEIFLRSSMIFLKINKSKEIFLLDDNNASLINFIYIYSIKKEK